MSARSLDKSPQVVKQEGTSPGEITQLLNEWDSDNDAILEKLMPLVYHELYQIARRRMRGERVNHTLETGALINEAYLRLNKSRPPQWENRKQFYGVAAQVMRRILIEHARQHLAETRGGRVPKVPLDMAGEPGPIAWRDPAALIDLDEALKRLAKSTSKLKLRQHKVVVLRFFGGLSVEETAEVLEVSPKTVKGDWALARAWLMHELSKQNKPAHGNEES